MPTDSWFHIAGCYWYELFIFKFYLLNVTYRYISRSMLGYIPVCWASLGSFECRKIFRLGAPKIEPIYVAQILNKFIIIIVWFLNSHRWNTFQPAQKVIRLPQLMKIQNPTAQEQLMLNQYWVEAQLHYFSNQETPSVTKED